MAPITALYGALAAILMLVLAVNVMRGRGVHKVGVGDGGEALMLRAIRVHGNATEYIPICLIVMLLYELEHGLPLLLHVAGILLIVGRLFHAWGLFSSAGASPGRLIGVAATFIAIVAPVIGILLKAFAAL